MRESISQALGIIPQNRNVAAITEGIHWNYTTILNIIFLVLAALLVIRFIRTGGMAMLKMMKTPAHQMDHHGSEHHEMSHETKREENGNVIEDGLLKGEHNR